MSKIQNLAFHKQPQEKLVAKGVGSLSDAELLAIVLRKGIRGKNVVSLSKEVLRILKQDFEHTKLDDLKSIKGVGNVKACQILSSIELSSRYLGKVKKKKILSPKDIFLTHKYLEKERKEYFIMVSLSVNNTIIKSTTLSVGILNASLVHPREVFLQAMHDNAASIILVHNHPSGSANPSEEDIHITKKIKEAGEFMGIPLQDHIIIGKGVFTSLKEHKCL